MNKIKTISILDNLIFICLILYALTFITNISTKFLFFSFYLCILKAFFTKPKISPSTKHIHFIIIFIICLFLSLILNNLLQLHNLTEYKSDVLNPLIGLIIFFVYKITYKKFLILLSAFSLTLSINALVILYQSYLGQLGRPVGLCDFHYMFLAGVNLLLIPIIFTYALKPNNYYPKLHWLFRITILLNIPAIIFENTRIVWIAFAIIFPLIIILSLKNKLKTIFIIFLAFLCCFFTFQNSPQSMNRLISITNNTYASQSNYERLLMWQSATNMFIDHPIIGVGYGNYYTNYISEYRSPLAREYQRHPHNTFLEKLSEAGILGGISYLLLILYFIFNSVKTFIKNKNPINLSYLACLLTYSIGCLTDCLYSSYNLKELTYIFYLFTGIYLILNSYIKQEHQYE